MSVEKNPTRGTSATPTSAATPDRRRWWGLAAVALGVSLIIMDATVVNVALPTVIEDLHLDATQAEWMNAIYSLVFAALLLTVGRAGDIWGRRRLFLLGMAIFVVASVLAGLSTTPLMLLGARLLQGLGAAMILPSTLSTLNAVFVGRERAIAFAVWGSTIGGMAALGPLVGGWLTTDYSWRWSFLLNVPVGLVVLALIVVAVPETRDEDAPRRLDLYGVTLSAVGLAGIVFALIEGQHYGWWRQADGTLSPVPVALVVGVVFLWRFWVVQRRRARAGKNVLVDLGLLDVRSFRFGSLAALIVALGEFGLLFTLPLLLQNALGFSALDTGWLIAALAMGTFVVSGMTPRLTGRFGGRAVVRAGLATEAVAVLGLALTVSLDISGWLVALWLFLYGLGVGMATAQLTSVILAEIPVTESGQASGLQSTFRQLGSALGVALLGTLLLTTLGRATTTNVEATGAPPQAAESISSAVQGSAGSVIPSLRADPATAAAGEAAAAALVTASRWTTGIAAGVIGVGLLATLALPYVSPDPGQAARREDEAAGDDGEADDTSDGDGDERDEPTARGGTAGRPAQD
ncbi:MAG: DHA2 family efflux MFS transporter permease subunit [Frankiales bacterium]|nr:DHA2 family efflux MFS transporter permease subunit [Frankiales bacterium]